MGGKLTRLRLLELVERESRVGGEPASPAGSGVEEVRAGECEQQDRKVAQAGAEQLDQVEQAAVGPMHVLEDQHRRPVAGDGLDEHSHREEQRLAVGDRGLAIEPEQDREVVGDAIRLRGPKQLRDFGPQLLLANLDRIALEDAAELLHLGGKGTVSAAVAIGQGTAPNAASSQLAHNAAELDPEPSLADSGRADNGDQVGRALVGDPFPDALEDSELSPAPDQWRARDG